MDYHGLPHELILKIFRNLTLQDLFFNVALVNKHFHKIAKDSTLLKSVTLNDIDKYVFEDTKKALEKATMIKELTLLENVLNPEKLLKTAFQSNKGLKSLKIDAHVSQELAEVIQTFGESHLEQLEIGLSPEINEIALMHLTKLKNLKSFNIKNDLTPLHLKSLALNCRNLENVAISILYNESSEAMEYFCHALQHSLTNLQFYYLQRTDWNFKSMSKLTKSTSLTLDLSMCFQLTHDQMSNMGKIPNLQILSITADDSFDMCQ